MSNKSEESFNKKMDVLEIYCDGSCLNNQGPIETRSAGWAIYSKNEDKVFSGKLSSEFNTNNKAELVATIHSVYYATKLSPNKTIIYTDSEYCINIITKYCIKWEKNRWKKSDGKPIENLNLVKFLYYLCMGKNIYFVHVYGHKGDIGNEKVDSAANAAAHKKEVGENPIWYI